MLNFVSRWTNIVLNLVITSSKVFLLQRTDGNGFEPLLVEGKICRLFLG